MNFAARYLRFYPRLPFTFDSTPPFLLTMSTTLIPKEIPEMSDDECTLHHYAAMVGKYLEAYKASLAESDECLKVPLKDALISSLVSIYSCDPPSNEAHICQRAAMRYYQEAERINTTPRIHPLLTSLCLEIERDEESPNIYSVSVDDPRAAKDRTYTPTVYFPPLDIHSPGKTCASPICDADGLILTLPRQINVKNVCFLIAQTPSQK